jgi:RNA polymerase sigma-70 factor (ECF subfamily)
MVGRTDMAQDLTQEVFLRVSRTASPAMDEVGQKAWLFKIARNLALNHIRDSKRRGQLVELQEAGSPATQELSAAIAEALGTLQELDRDVFVLREIAGLTYEDIAGTCDVTTEAVRARLRRARHQLRAMLGERLVFQRERGVVFSRGGG